MPPCVIIFVITTVHSIKEVERQYATGEEPLLVLCSDLQEYVCKYARNSGAAYKLASEFVGSQLASAWGLNTPQTAFVTLQPTHWVKAGEKGTLAFGSCRLDGVIDINPTTVRKIRYSQSVLSDLIDIALFDFWVANEDRNANNANLMYDVERDSLISIDYGCIFNTATYNYQLSQLTTTDTILASDLFYHLQKGTSGQQQIEKITKNSIARFYKRVANCERRVGLILKELPEQWRVPFNVVENKMNQLFDGVWLRDALSNFKECLEENIIK